MAKYHGIDWNKVERRVQARDSILAWIESNPDMNGELHYHKGEPYLHWTIPMNYQYKHKRKVSEVIQTLKNWGLDVVTRYVGPSLKMERPAVYH